MAEGQIKEPASGTRASVVGTCSYFILSNGWAETASLAVNPEPRFTGVGVLLQTARRGPLGPNW